MHTIVIKSDTLTHDDQVIQTIKEMFPDCSIQIFPKTVEESGSRKDPPRYNLFSH